MKRRIAGAAVAITVAVALTAAVLAVAVPTRGASAAPAAPPAHTSQAGYWTRSQEAAAYVEARADVNQTALTDFTRAWQMQAYWPTSHLRAAILAVAANDAAWADTMAAGHWSPSMRPLARAAVLEMRTWVAWWRAIAALPTAAAMDAAYAAPSPGFTAANRLRVALGVPAYTE